MPVILDDSSENQSFFQKALDYAKGFGKRIVVHVCALLCAAVVASSVGGVSAFLGTYFGLICLVARESCVKTKWLLPSSLGLVQAALCLFMGLPLYQCIFWGGMQSFVQRIFAKRFELGFEWFICIFLIPVSLSYLLSLPNVIFLLASFAAIAVSGSIFWRLYKPKNAKDDKKSKAKGEPIKQDSPKEEPLDPFEDYRKSIAKMRVKQILLPKKLQSTVQALTMSAESIIICMTEDKRDLDAGKRFLNRYLPAAHSVLDNYSRHAKDAATNPQVAKALSQSEDVLIRLEQAFAYEHNHLQKNNIDDFSAELNVLDTLLKMDGK